MAKLKIAQELLDIIYPIGSIYLTVNDVDPKNLFGGTWTKMSGGYLYGVSGGAANSSYTGTGTQTKAAVTSGGPSTNTSGSTALTVNQIPSHNHPMLANKNAGGQNAGIQHTWGTAYSGYDDNSCGYTGGGQGHTHTLSSHTHSIPAHSHNIAYIGVWCWKRTA